MTHQNFVMVCPQGWDISLATNARSMARELAKSRRVLYVNAPLDIIKAVRDCGQADVKKRLQALFNRRESLVQAEPNIWVLTPTFMALSINWLASRRAFNALNRWNSKKLARSIREAGQTLGLGSYHLLVDSIVYQGLHLKRLLSPLSFIYYLRDYVLTVTYFRRHGTWAEAQLLQQADTVVANSAYLTDYARRYNPHSYDIGQGCELSMYRVEADYAMPDDLATVPAPIIGYTGFVTHSRLDVELLLTIARQRPAWSLVLVGPEDQAFRQSPLHGLPNVFFLGSKPPEQLAAYLRHFTVCINPQLLNEATTGNYPLKIDEYLAMGKPVVATATLAMAMFADHVHLAYDPEEWLCQLATALAPDTPQQRDDRIAFARSHSWAASVRKLSAAVGRSCPASLPLPT